jgi:HlyD family secretion protein
MRQAALLALAAAMLLGACEKIVEEPPEAPPARAVRVVKIQSLPLVGSVSASGDLVAREEAAVQPEVSGYRVAKVLVDVGAYVQRGQVLAELDPMMIQAQLAQQEALAAQAEAQAAMAEDQAKRVAGLDESGALSQEQIDQRRYQARAARATANAQAAALSDVRTRAGKFKVTAPVAGLVLERNVRPGDLAAGGAAPWFRLARDGQIELAAQMSETDMARIRPGQPATVTLPGGGSVEGVVRLISPQIDPRSKLAAARITLPVRADIRAGGFGRALFAETTERVLAVPESAVRYDADGAVVMVVGSDNKVKRAMVRTGRRGAGLVELLSGPPVDTLIVKNAAAFLLDGDEIEKSEEPAPP